MFREYTRLDVEPNAIPVELFTGFLERLADSCNMSIQRARAATQGLIDKGKFDAFQETKEERMQNEREILRDLLLHDLEIRAVLTNLVAELSVHKTE